MKLVGYIAGLLVFSAIVATYSAHYYQSADAYQVTVNETSFSAWTSIEETSNLSEEIIEDVRGAPVGEDSDVTYSFISGSYGAMKILFNSFDIADDAITTTGDHLGVDPIWITVGILVLVLAIIFTIITGVLNINQ